MLTLPSAASLIVSAIATSYLCSKRSRLRIMDRPNERSLHAVPVPRTGGLALLAGAATGWVIAAATGHLDSRLVWLAVAALVVGGISLLDDIRNLSSRLRLLVQCFAATIVLFSGSYSSQLPVFGVVISLSWPVAAMLSLLFILWFTNLYNFMDGMDGFAGGMTVAGFGAFFVLAWNRGAHVEAAILASIASSAVGFLIFNFPPARIFMGDVGSSTLGFLAGGFSLWGAVTEIIPIESAIVIFSPFIVDATATLLRRAFTGEKFWLPHRTHYYQRLVQAGWGHRKTVLSEYMLMSLSAASGIAVAYMTPSARLCVVVAWAGVYSLTVFSLVPAVERRKDTETSAGVT